MMGRFHFPLRQSVRGYQSSWAQSDLSAGLAVAAVALPISIAYPAIAGLPPQTGFFASIVAMVAYALFGPSRQLILGPDAATMTVLAAVLPMVLSTLPADNLDDRTSATVLITISVGIMCLVARFLRLGTLASFLSRPILTGFFAGISLSILVGQIGRFTGVKIEAKGLIPPFVELARKIEAVHRPTLLIAIGMFILLQVLRKARFPIPGPIVVVVLSVILSAILNFENMGVAVVGSLPAALPSFSLPSLTAFPVDTVLLGAGAIFLVSFGSGIVTARSFGALSGQDVNPDRELLGFGAANLAAGFFGAFPVTAADSRTAINVTVGGRTQITGLVAASMLIATLLFLSDILRILPIPALGAILAAAAVSLIDVAGLRQIWRVSRMEAIFALIAFLGPTVLGVLNGIIIAVIATLVYVLRKAMQPRDALLGRIPDRDGFYKLHSKPEARPVDNLILFRIQGSLVFFSSDFIKLRLREIADSAPAGAKWLIIDAGAITQIDSSGAAILVELAKEFESRGLKLGLAELHSEVRSLLVRTGVIRQLDPSMIFDNLDDALRAFRMVNC